MRRLNLIAFLIAITAFAAGVALAQDQGTFKIPFEFQAAGKKLPKGDYAISGVAEGKVTLRQESTGKEIQVPILNKKPQPTPPVTEPRLVFDAVGNFEPSYTEYFTVYILAEVWFPGQEGLELHVTKGAHQTKVVKGETTKK
jgi:hypothetical protein